MLDVAFEPSRKVVLRFCAIWIDDRNAALQSAEFAWRRLYVTCRNEVHDRFSVAADGDVFPFFNLLQKLG